MSGRNMSQIDSGEKSVQVYKVTNNVFENIGEVDFFDSFIWEDSFFGVGSFEFWLPMNNVNLLLFEIGNILWIDGNDSAGIIEISKTIVNQYGVKQLNIKGRTLELFLKNRIIWNTFYASNIRCSTAAYNMVYQNAISPSVIERRIPFLQNLQDAFVGNYISTQITGGELYDAVDLVTFENNLGYSINFKPFDKYLEFSVKQPIDRSESQNVNKKVLFSDTTDDVTDTEFYFNNEDYKNVAYVAGEGEGAERKVVQTGDTSLFGFSRVEMYVDARDVQSSFVNEQGQTIVLPTEQYNVALTGRGDEKLSEKLAYETLSSSVRDIGAQFVYGVDYFLGDKVTVEDTRIGKKVNANITKVTETFSSAGYKFGMTFGYDVPSLVKRLG